MHFLIIGIGGSIGFRHYQNIISLGHTCSGVEIDTSKYDKLNGIYIYKNINDAFEKEKFDVVIVSTPTQLHISQSQDVALRDIKGLMVEKPLSYSMDGVDTLINLCTENNIKLMTGCNLRFTQGVKLIKILLNNKAIGDIYSANYFYGSSLKKWHLDTDYRNSYSAGQFGGIGFDDVHAPDIIEHLFDEITDITGYLNHTGLLDIVNEDVVDYIVRCGILCHIHSDYIQSVPQRTLEIWGSTGQIQYDFFEGVVNLRTDDIPEWRSFDVKEPLNNQYLEELKYFVGCVEKNITPMTNGLSPLRWILELKKQNEGH